MHITKVKKKMLMFNVLFNFEVDFGGTREIVELV